MIINGYNKADLTVLITVVDTAGDPYEFAGTNVISVYKPWSKTALFTIALTYSVVDGKGVYTGSVTNAQMGKLEPGKYPMEWMVTDTTIRKLKTGSFNVSNVYFDKSDVSESSFIYDTATNEVTVSDSDTAAALAIAAQTAAETAQTAAELAQTGAETAETNAGLSETAASGYATDAEGFKDDAEAAADKALSRIKDKKQVTADYTLLVTDEGTMILAEHAATKINITVPNNLFIDFTDGYPVIAVRRKGLAEVEIISDGVSVIVGGANISEQNHTVSIDWEDASTVTVTGGVS